MFPSMAKDSMKPLNFARCITGIRKVNPVSNCCIKHENVKACLESLKTEVAVIRFSRMVEKICQAIDHEGNCPLKDITMVEVLPTERPWGTPLHD